MLKNIISFYLLLVSNFIIPQTNQPNKYLNLNFESSNSIGTPKGWNCGGQGYSILIDSTVTFSGNKSLSIKKITSGDYGAATSYFPLNEAKGKHLRFTGYIKTKDVTEGYAGLWWNAMGDSDLSNSDYMEKRGVTGNTDWKKYVIELNISDNVKIISFGVQLAGNGTAWFDNLQIELDDKIYQQTEPLIPKIIGIQTDWMKNNIIPFDTSEHLPVVNNLNFLDALIGNATIVSLGEGTHGTHEFFMMKQNIIKYLCTQKGFTVFAIEANMPEARAINNYILTGKGDPKKSLAGLYFWTWNTQEVLDMIEWMKAFNKSGKGRIEFLGLDMQFPKVAMENVIGFINKCEPEYYEHANKIYQKIDTLFIQYHNSQSPPEIKVCEQFTDSAKDIYTHILGKDKIYATLMPKDSVNWIIKNSEIVVQSLQSIWNFQLRDSAMTMDLNLLKTIEANLLKNKIPLFISEGSSQQKLKAIYTDSYLTFVYNKFSYVEEGVTIYGSSLSKSDNHIITILNGNKELKHIAISVYTEGKNSKDIERDINQIKSKLNVFLNGKGNSLEFYDYKTSSFYYQ